METYSISTSSSSNRSSSNVAKENVTFSDIEEVLLALLSWRSIDAQAANPILGDHYAVQVVEKCQFDMSKPFFMNDQRWVRYVCSRAKTLDKWCQQFLDNHRHEPVQVIHIGCGLDSRNLRVRWTDRDVRWYDIDLLVVCDLRRRVMPLPPTQQGKSEYNLRSLSALIFYFSPQKAQKLIHDVVEYFGSGQLAFDAVGSLSLKYKPAPFKNTSLSSKWGIDDARQIEKFHPKLKMTGRLRWEDYMGNEASLGQSAPPVFGAWTQAMLALKNNAVFKEILQELRFDFGDRAKSAASSELGPFSAVSVLEGPVDGASEKVPEEG